MDELRDEPLVEVELGRFESQAELKPFDLVEIARTNYDPTDYQKALFVASSFSEMEKRVGGWLEEVLEAQQRHTT